MAKFITKTSLLNQGHFQRTHYWDLEVIRRPIIASTLDEGVLRANVKSTDVPKYEVETSEVNIRGMKWEESVNVLTNGEWKFSTLELVTAQFRGLALAWQNALRDQTLSRRDMTADFKLTSKNMQKQSNMIYLIKNWFPTDVDVPENSSDAGLQEITFTGKYMDLEIRKV